MLVIHYPTAYRALDIFVDTFNEGIDKAARRLRTGPLSAAKELIRIYGVSLLKANAVQIVLPEALPSLQTNNQQLARQLKCSCRTVQRYLHKLSDAGIITQKIFHGSNANYELWLHPGILLVKQKLDVEKCRAACREALERAHRREEASRVAAQEQTPNCRHTYTGNTLNNLIIQAENPKNRLISPETQASQGIGPVHNPKKEDWNTGEIAKKDPGQPGGKILRENFENKTAQKKDWNTGEIALKKIEKADEKIFSEKKSSGKIPEGTGEIVSRADQLSLGQPCVFSPARDNSLSLYVKLFWLTARNLLYKNTDLTDRQVESTKALIKKLYDPVADKDLDHVHQHYVARIGLVAKYIRREPAKRFVPLPFWYFNTNNPKGFLGTKAWYRATLLRQREVERELLVKRLVRQFQNNETREPAKRVPPLTLYRQLENKLGKLGDPLLVERFQAGVLQHGIFAQLQFTE